jgi:glycosyltransferase involved in cell wall biosynthesis
VIVAIGWLVEDERVADHGRVAAVDRMTRVAYICADQGVPVFGTKGSSVHVQEVVRAMLGRGCRVDLFAARPDGDPPTGLETVRVHAFASVPRGDTAGRERAVLANNEFLHATLKRSGPFDLIYERYSLWSFAGIEYAVATGTPGLLEVNAPLIEEQQRYRTLVDRAAAQQVAERAFAGASALIAVSAETAAYLNSYPAARGRVHIVPNGVNVDRFSPRLDPARLRSPGTFTIGFVGSLKPWHGLSILVDAFAIVVRHQPHASLLIVGDGPERSNLIAGLSARGLLEAAHFTGAVAPVEVPALLASMDAAVAPYPDLQGFYFSPLKVYEYMAAQLPVVASGIGQITEIIQDGNNGLLCPPGDPYALASALERLAEDDRLRVDLGTAARASMLRHHTWDATVERILNLAGLGIPRAIREKNAAGD